MRSILLALAASLTSLSLASANECASYNLAVTDGSYWSSVSSCSPCVQAGCSYCIATFTCEDTSAEPLSCAPEDTITPGNADLCPGTLQCFRETRYHGSIHCNKIYMLI